MKKLFKIQMRKWCAASCLGLFFAQTQAAQFVEISADIETFGYRLADTNSIASAQPKTLHVVCIAGGDQWFIADDFHGKRQWLFDGTNVLLKPWPLADSWKSRDGHPMGDLGVNIPWLAFCSGAYLKRERRMIPLPAAVLSACPDRFAYSDATTTFADELGLPRSLDLFSSSALFLKSHTDWDKELSFGTRYTEWNNKTSLKIEDGLLIFHYGVLESTNILHRSFPTRFEFFQTGRRHEQDGNWFCHGTGHIKSIGLSTQSPMAQWNLH